MLLEDRAEGVSRPSLDAHTAGTGTRDRMERRILATMERRDALDERIDGDYALIDAACNILYGIDGRNAGFATIDPSWTGWTADAIYHHFLSLKTWEETAALVGYSYRYVLERVAAGFAIMDEIGMTATVSGSTTKAAEC